MKRRTLLSTLPAALLLGVAGASPPLVHARAAPKAPSPVGTWTVRVDGAPFTHHLFSFYADGTMLQVNPDAGDPTTSDSDGLGIWAVAEGGIQGTFKEINADRSSHQFVSFLIVTFTLHMGDHDTFKGPAVATLYGPDGSVQSRHDAMLSGTRMRLSAI